MSCEFVGKAQLSHLSNTIGKMSLPVKMANYDPNWPKLFEKEKNLILGAVGRIVVGIEHIGSTAVPGLGAKPIIDILVAVSHLSDAKRCIEPLKMIGYEYQPRFEADIPERRFFGKGEPPKEQHYHLHMVACMHAPHALLAKLGQASVPDGLGKQLWRLRRTQSQCSLLIDMQSRFTVRFL